MSVLDASTYAAKARDPAAPRLMPSTWQKFADFVQHSDKPIEERFYDVRTDDGWKIQAMLYSVHR